MASAPRDRQRLRIALVSTSFPSWEGDPAGHFVLADARRRKAAGAEVHVVAPGERTPFDDALEAEGIDVARAGGGRLFGWPGAVTRVRDDPWRALWFAGFAWRVDRRLRRLAPLDQIVAHWMVPSGLPLSLRHRGRLECIAHGGDVRALLALPAAVRAGVIRALVARGATVCFVGEELRERLLESLAPDLRRELAAASRVDPAPIEVAFDRAGSARLRRDLGLGDGARLAVCVGRLVPAKRADLAIDAASAAGDTTLVIVGDGPSRSALAAACDPRRVVFTGLVPRHRALDWIAAADVLIHPSAEEGAPSTVREARELGVPVVACAAGDVARWAQNDPGITIAAADAQALAHALRRVACATDRRW